VASLFNGTDPGSDGSGNHPPQSSVLRAAVVELVRLTDEIKRGVEQLDYMGALAALSGLQPVEHHLGGQLTIKMMEANDAPDDPEDGSNGEHRGGVYL